jgi:shikimate dehydrogenase
MMKFDSSTKVFCIIGDPIEHSLSPAMHNAVFEKLGLNCVYLAFRVVPAGLKDAIQGFKALGIGGANVTIPHKISVIEHLDGLSKEAEIIGAVNTIKIEGGAVGFNTDGLGALRALEEGGADPDGKNIIILGYGGAARAIAITLALCRDVNSLVLMGRDKEKMERLVNDIRSKTGVESRGIVLSEESKKEIREADILINCTPVGMHPNIDETLVTSDMLEKGMYVMDIVYNPRETRLLREAKKAGCHTIDGVGMLVYQAAEAEKIWLGIDPPVNFMRKIAIKELER